MSFETGAGSIVQEAERSTGHLEALPTGRRILLAEDDEELRALLASALRHDGHLVDEAINGMDLLAKVGRSLLGLGGAGIDLVVTDVQMPGFSGLDVLAALHETAPALAVIVISAFGTPELHDEADRLGARAFFDKPFDVDELCVAVGRLARPPR